MIYDDCPVMFGTNPDRRCVGCGKPLTGRVRVWCDGSGPGSCQSLWQQNHIWESARHAAVRRDGFRCRHCGVGLRVGTPSRYSRDWSIQWPTHYLEVNHMTPILGRHHQVGCWHHQEGLETLCRACHQIVTAQQFGYRRRQNVQQQGLGL